MGDGIIERAVDVFGSTAFLVGWITGALSVWAWCKVADWWHNRRTGEHRATRLKATWAVGGIVLLFVAYSAVSTARADHNATAALARAEAVAAEAKQFAEETRRCQNELIESLNARTGVTTSNDKLSLDRFLAVSSWLHDLIFPPPDIAALDQNNPRRVAWAIMRTQQADNQIRASIDEQQRNEAIRRANPLPRPNCP